MSITKAGRYYLDAICPTNEVSDELFKAAQIVGSFYAPDIQRLAGDLADLFIRSAEQLDDPPAQWPDDVREPIQDTVDRLLRGISPLLFLKEAKNDVAAATAWDQLIAGVDNSAQQLVRLRLDLPAADSSDDGC